MTSLEVQGRSPSKMRQLLSKANRLVLGEGPGNMSPYSEFATLICTLEGLKVSQCPVFPILLCRDLRRDSDLKVLVEAE